MIYPLFFQKRRNIPKGRVAEIDIDIASHKKERAFEVVQRKLRALGGDIVRVGTFGTITSKSAIQTASRGLGIEKEIYQHLSNLIPIHRGNPRSLHECYYGSEEHEPIHEFKRICDEYAHLNLIQIALRIEGLIDKRSVHSCGIVITNRHITHYNCRAVTPGGNELVTMWDLADTEQCGLIKYD